MLTKKKVITAINKLPGTFSVEDVMDELLLLDKIESGLKQSESNDIIPDSDLDNKLPEWLR